MSTAPIGRMSFSDYDKEKYEKIKAKAEIKPPEEEKVLVKRDFRPAIITRRKFVYAFDTADSDFKVGEVIDMVFNSECCVYQIRTIKGHKEYEFWTYRILKKLPPIK